MDDDGEIAKPTYPEVKELIKEQGWDKKISDMMKAKIDEEIVVLAQSYANVAAEKKKTKEQKKAEKSGEAVAQMGDGTQIRAYVNNV